MNKAMQRYIEAASGVTNVTKNSAERIVRQLVKQGEAAADNAQELVEDLLRRQRQNRDALATLVKTETNRVVKAMGLVSAGELERLQNQVADLKRKLAEAEKRAGTATARTAAKKTTRKAAKKSTKTTAKKSTRKSAKKSS